MPKSYASTVVSDSASNVWKKIRDFNSLPQWHPVITGSSMDDNKAGDVVGSIRTLVTGDGAKIREVLSSMSDKEMSYSYEFVGEPPFPVLNYHATMKVSPVTDEDAAFVEWFATFDCDKADIGQWQSFFAQNIFKPGLDSLKKKAAAK